MDTVSYKMNLKNTLRNHLLGKENIDVSYEPNIEDIFFLDELVKKGSQN